MPSLGPEFLHDVFISYSHGDPDGTGDTHLKTWSQAFARELRKELRGLPGWAKADIFLDEGSIDRADPLTEQLRESLIGSAILLILMSPHYLGSTACAHERAWWAEKAATEAFPEVRNRVLIGRIWPLEKNTSWPSELCDEVGQPPIGFWFHERPGDPIESRPFGWPDPTGDKGDFRKSIVGLAGVIANRLSQLKQSLDRKRRATAEAARLGAAGGQAIYVHARLHDLAVWESVRQQLIAAGYGVVPDSPASIPSNLQQEADLETENLRMLTACDGLLLISGNNPNHLASDLVVVGHQRRNSARALSGKPLPCAVIDQGLQHDAKSRHEQSAKNMQIDWINASISDWTGEVKSWLGVAADLQRGAL